MQAKKRKNTIKMLKELHADIQCYNRVNADRFQMLSQDLPELKDIVQRCKDNKKQQQECVNQFLDTIIAYGNMHPHYESVCILKDGFDLCEHLKEKYKRLQKDLAKTQKAT